jgi:LysM repeat protein
MILLPDKKKFLLLLGILFSLAAYSQETVPVERSVNKVILEGKVYYIHVVKPGQTLYAISRAYNISQKEIAVENPGVVSGIQVGQALKIPVEPNLVTGIDTSEQEMVPEGKNTHKVLRGETVYSISRMYGITEALLLKANPSVEADNLRPGQRLLIPEPPRHQEAQEPVYNEEGFAYHKVKRRETLYSIAGYYHVTVEDIRNANPELGWGGPGAGQVIRIPLPQVIDQPRSAPDTATSDTLLYSLSQPLTYGYEELEFEHDRPGRTYRIAYFIPFDFQAAEPLDSLLKDVESAARRSRIIDRYRQEQKVPQSVNFLEFFQGSLLALDSMRQTGMKLDVHFFDTHKSMERTRSLLEENEMEDMDLIIGPFYPFNVEIVAAFAKEHRIPMVTPFYDETDLLQSNPYLFQLSSSLETGYREVAKLVASKHDYNIVYVREEDSLNVEKHSYLQELIFDGFDDYRPEEPVIFKELVLTLEHTDEIIQSLSADRKNLVVVPTRNEALASRVVSSLYYRLKDFDIELVGTPFWTEFSSIDYRYYHELSLIFYSNFWLDYLDPQVDEFLRKYRGQFYAEPRAMTRKGINYGISGYDMTLYFTNALRLYGRRFILSLDRYDPEQVLESYRFSRFSAAGGYENTRISFHQFLPDMTIVGFEVPELPEKRLFFRPLEDERQKYLNYDPFNQRGPE